MNKSLRTKNILINLSPIFVFFVVFGGLELAIVLFNIPAWQLPSPTSSFKVLFNDFHKMVPAVMDSLQAIIVGWLIGTTIGITLAFVFTSNQLLDKAISPYVIFLIVTPQMIMVPLLMLWMGFGMRVKFVAVLLSSFPINMTSTMAGVRSVSIPRYELMQTLRAKKLQTFFSVLVPSALPNIFNGMRLATIFATTSAIGAELISGNTGIGPMISKNAEFMRMDVSFAYVYLSALIGITLYTGINLLERRIVKYST